MPKLSGQISRIVARLRHSRHKLDAAIIASLIIAAGIIGAVNMTGYPQRFEDEGTYVSQAWAVKERGTLSHYTYWYDHPPGGWIQMAGYLLATDAIGRYNSAISAGREFMLLVHMITVGLLYALMRRLKIGRIAAGLGMLAYVLSPLVVEFSRYILLDNIALPWLLAAFFLALSPRKHLLAAIGSAICMVIAVLSKETFIVLLPVLLYALWQSGDIRNRRYMLTSFTVVFVMLSSIYVLYAVLKNELFPGVGHVSLLGSLFWQLFSRAGSGSIFDAASGTRGLVGYWLSIDYWLLLAGVICLPLALFLRNLRLMAVAFLIGLVMLLRKGYLPYPYVIILLPFAALVFAGVIDRFVINRLLGRGLTLRRALASAAAVALISGVALIVVPQWQPKLNALTSVDQDTSSRQAVAWINDNISHDNRLVVESALWTDLLVKGYNRPDPVWLYKTETDPAVTKEIRGWRGIDYVILNGPTVGSKNFSKSFPTVNEAIKNSQVVAEFGKDNLKIIVYKVQNNKNALQEAIIRLASIFKS